MRNLIELLVTVFKTVYLPGENVAIDEELVKFKGRLLIRQYIPAKRAQFGIKLFSLCEDSGYCWNSYVYLGKNVLITDEEKAIQKEVGKTGLVVINLLKELFGSERKLWVDNWYNSESLFRLLEVNNIAACGTAKINRISVPKSFHKLALV